MVHIDWKPCAHSRDGETVIVACKRTGASVKLTVLAKENVRVTDELGGRRVNQYSKLDEGQDLLFTPSAEHIEELLVGTVWAYL